MPKERNTWKLGEIVKLPRTVVPLKNKRYQYFSQSRYVCIREALNGKRGILIKYLGKVTASDIMVVGGEPFCKDDKWEGLESDFYYSFRFPTLDELNEVVDIIEGNETLQQQLADASFHIDLNKKFWVRETIRVRLIHTKLQFFDPISDSLEASGSDDDSCQRISIVYF